MLASAKFNHVKAVSWKFLYSIFNGQGVSPLGWWNLFNKMLHPTKWYHKY